MIAEALTSISTLGRSNEVPKFLYFTSRASLEILTSRLTLEEYLAGKDIGILLSSLVYYSLRDFVSCVALVS